MDDDEFAREIGRLRAFGSDFQFFEVKSCRCELTRDIGKTISAFANGPGGVIVCGLDERDGFAPVKGFEPARIQDALIHVCAEKMTPRVIPLIDVRLFEGAPVVTAFVPELRPKDKPCYITTSGLYSGSYVRTGDGDRRLSPYEVDRLLEEHEQPCYDDAIVPDATMDDLDEKLVAGLLERERGIHARQFAQLDGEDALVRLHVARRDEQGVMRPTMAGLLALGSYPQEFFPRLNVTFTCYPGLTKADTTADNLRFLDYATLLGSIPDMVNDLVAAVRRNMRVAARIEVFRRDVPEYPIAAVREAVVNALMHRDYSPVGCATAVYVDMYADRLEVINPGGLYGAVTVDTLELGVAGSTRNRRLAAILESTPLNARDYVAENRGSGYCIIRGEAEKAGLPQPVPRDSISLFTLTFPTGARAAGAQGGEAVGAGIPGVSAVGLGAADAVCGSGGAPYKRAAAEGRGGRTRGRRDGYETGRRGPGAQTAPHRRPWLEPGGVRSAVARAYATSGGIRGAADPGDASDDATPRSVGGGGHDLPLLVLDVIVERGSASTQELIDESGRSRPTVLKSLHGLMDEGYLVPTESRNSPRQRYRLSEWAIEIERADAEREGEGGC